MDDRDPTITTTAPCATQSTMPLEGLDSASTFWSITSLVLTALLAVSGALAWRFSSWTASAKEERLKLEIASANARGSEANEKAAIANERAALLEKEAAQAKLELEKIKDKQRPRTITEQQRAAFIKVATNAPKAKVAMVLNWSSGDEATQYAAQIRQMMVATGFTLGTMPGFHDGDPVSGLFISFSDPLHPPENGEVLPRLFSDAGIIFKIAKRPDGNDRDYVVIIVGAKE